MYCPRCRAEYREGVAACSECDVALVTVLAPEQAPEYEQLVTVFEGDSSGAAVARGAVESTGIHTWTKDEEVHGLFPSLGPTEILVCEEDEKQALTALDSPNHRSRGTHDSAHSTSRRLASTPCADDRSAFGPHANDSGIAQAKLNEASEQGHHIKDHHRQGKRV